MSEERWTCDVCDVDGWVRFAEPTLLGTKYVTFCLHHMGDYLTAQEKDRKTIEDAFRATQVRCEEQSVKGR